MNIKYIRINKFYFLFVYCWLHILTKLVQTYIIKILLDKLSDFFLFFYHTFDLIIFFIFITLIAFIFCKEFIF
jgi:hypothetical protein